ncbi:MAG: C1 family peptidase [Oligoflexia bacterium]|nr:C1 family peptidase [Oligoflexia bacterium]
MARLLLVLGFVFISQQVLAQKLMRPYRILKSPERMMQEAQSGKSFLDSVTDGEIPAKFDLIQFQTPVKDQGDRGSCVAFASVALVESLYKVKNRQNIDLSEQYAYWASKAVNKIAPFSDGSYPLPFLRSVAQNGVPAEQAWPYEKTPWFENPSFPDCVKANQTNPEQLPTHCVTNGNPAQAVMSASKIKITNPHAVPSSAEAIVGFLRKGVVVEIGADVYKKAWSFHNKTSPQYFLGVVTMPQPGDELIGGHAVLLVGYDMDQKVFIFKNSWGTQKWASKSPIPGYGTIPFDYVRKYAEAVVARMP